MHRVFVEALQRLWGPDYWVAWPPDSRLALGDVGFVEDGRFTVNDRLGLAIETEPAGARAEVVYDSDGAVSVTFKAAGESPEGFRALGAADVGARVRFGREQAVLAVYTDLRETRIRALRDLAGQLTRRFWTGEWTARDAVVIHVVQAGSATVLVGAGSEAQAELRAEGSAAASLASLGALAADVSFAHRDRLGYTFTGRRVTPFFRLLRLRKTFTGRIEQRYGRGIADGPARMPASVIAEAIEHPELVVEEIDQMATLDGAAS